ncbi:MAG: PQQ-dependent sugar dehydrogenase [Saprospiraceae bacterium]|nr:PQQ-dependent sugar dehydrogenase [Saprospiraceae bacterium]
MNIKRLLTLGITLCMLQACQPVTEQTELLPPEENRFTTTILSPAGSLDEPMAFSFLNREEMLIVERKGAVKSFHVDSRQMRTVGHIPVNTKYVNKAGRSREAEEGLMGVIAHPDYVQNNWVFMHYADPDEPKHVLARWEYKNDSLYEDTKVVVLEYPTQREECCHTGGGMVFDKAGNLYLTTGNNTINPPQGTSNLDERPGHKNSDDQRTAGNTNDLRGKILRIHPEDDGSYSIPDGNLFPENTANARAEIYTMGHRNPWRVSIDSKTGYIYWGEVGPDAAENTELGPRGYDEFNQARGPGFFGWPYFIGNNIPYVDSLGKSFDPEHPVNHSPNNTGLNELPTAESAFIWYPYAYSEEFPELGSAGRSATGGPVFRLADFPESDKRFPAYYEGKWLISEFMRGWIMAVSMDENGDYLSMEPFLPNETFISAIDMQFSPDGDLYVLEYGSAWFKGNDNALVKRVQFNAGNRPPVVKISVDKAAGALPLAVQLSSDGTIDYDEDQLSYSWTITADNGFEQTSSEQHPKITLEKAGLYRARLSVTDAANNTEAQELEIIAGNAPPEIAINITEGNQSFYFPGSTLAYQIEVQDQEDGSSSAGSISADAIAINFDYVPEGFDPIEIAQNHRSTDDWVAFSKGRTLIDGSDCFSCHRIEVKSIGPSYQAVAQKYPNTPQNRELLASRIIKGSVGIWGEHGMSAHPDFSQEEAELMADYIMSLNDPQSAPAEIPLTGTHRLTAPENSQGKGGYLLRVAYTDQGAEDLKTIASEKIIPLRNPSLLPERADEIQDVQILTSPNRVINIAADNALLAYRDLDLTGVTAIEMVAEASSRDDAAGGSIEIRLDGPDGQLLGSTPEIQELDIDFKAELEKMKAEWVEGGKKGREPNRWTVRNKFRPRFDIPVEGVTGRHDLYFVFKNPAAKPGQILLRLHAITCKNTKSPT